MEIQAIAVSPIVPAPPSVFPPDARNAVMVRASLIMNDDVTVKVLVLLK